VSVVQGLRRQILQLIEVGAGIASALEAQLACVRCDDWRQHRLFRGAVLSTLTLCNRRARQSLLSNQPNPAPAFLPTRIPPYCESAHPSPTKRRHPHRPATHAIHPWLTAARGVLYHVRGVLYHVRGVLYHVRDVLYHVRGVLYHVSSIGTVWLLR
jgi:hypothetical protein